MVFVNGAGILTDAFEENAVGILSTLRLAMRRNIPTAMMGQGIGPIEGEGLRRLAADVLPQVRLIGIREDATSLPLLMWLGVPARA